MINNNDFSFLLSEMRYLTYLSCLLTTILLTPRVHKYIQFQFIFFYKHNQYPVLSLTCEQIESNDLQNKYLKIKYTTKREMGLSLSQNMYGMWLYFSMFFFSFKYLLRFFSRCFLFRLLVIQLWGGRKNRKQIIKLLKKKQAQYYQSVDYIFYLICFLFTTRREEALKVTRV